MELADGGDLNSKIEGLKKSGSFMPEDEIWKVVKQLVQGLRELHRRKIVHRDIKCANIFLNLDGTVKLGDLNVSKIAKLGIMKTQTGTPYYASPEVWQDKPYSSKCDIWSMGCVIYELACQKPPFQAKDMAGLYSKVIKGVYPKLPSHYSQDLHKLIECMLEVDPVVRPSAEEIVNMQVFPKRKINIQVSDESSGDELLGTIRIPKNLK